MPKNIPILVFILLCLLLLLTPLTLARSLEISDLVETPNGSNPRVQFYYYIPETVMQNHYQEYPVLVCMPSLGSSGWKFVTPPIRKFAETEGFILLAPTFFFNARDHVNQNSYLFLESWSGEALLQMVKKIEQDQNLSIGSYYFYGFSAGANFSLRFALWKPELATAVSAHGNSDLLVPTEKIPVQFLVSSGVDDQGAMVATQKFNQLATDLGIQITFQEYEGGHWLPEQKTLDTLEFFREVHQNHKLVLFNPGLTISIYIFLGGLLILYLVTNPQLFSKKSAAS